MAAVTFAAASINRNTSAGWDTIGRWLEGTSTVRVNIIDPGKVRTTMRRQAYPSELAESLPTPESLTAPYLALLGPASRGVTGQRFEAQDTRPAQA